MPAHRVLPSDSILEKWLEEGLSHQQMADRVYEQTGIRVGRSSISAAMTRAGLTNRIRYDDWLPWNHIGAAHNQENDAQLLRLGARLMYGVNSEPKQVQKFTNWARRLREARAVVFYNPDLPDGFGWTRARSQDTGVVYCPRGFRAPHVDVFVNALLDGRSLTVARRAAKASLAA